MKRCTVCGEKKAETEFYTNEKKCKACHILENLCRKRGEVLPERLCLRCDVIKTKEHFPVVGKGLRRWCYDCESPENMDWCFVCKEHKPLEDFKHRASGRKCQDCRREYERIRSLRRYYGMSLEDYEKAYEEQEGKCWICSSTEKLVVDHNHSTDSGFRALLCATCNLGIGYFKDQPELLRKAETYLLTFGFNSKGMLP